VARASLRDLQRGEVYGCSVIKRISSPRSGNPRYLVTETCCGREVTRDYCTLMQMRTHCTHCRSQKK
jgi:hypothetical protein